MPRVTGLLAVLLWACGGDAGVEPKTRQPKFIDARRLYAEKLDGSYRESGGGVAAKGKYLETLELRIPQADPTWCETFPSPDNRTILRDLGYRTVIVRDSDRQVCWIPIRGG